MARSRSSRSRSSSASSTPSPATSGPTYVATCSSPIPAGADIWYAAAKPPPPAWGRQATADLVQGGLGGIGLGITYVALVIGTFFFVTVGLFSLIIAVLYGLNVAVGTM